MINKATDETLKVCVCVFHSEEIAAMQSYKIWQEDNYMSKIMHLEASF